MAKTYTGGAHIPYDTSDWANGVKPANLADGALVYHKDTVNTSLSGLWLFGFIKDQSANYGPQVAQTWRQISFDAGSVVQRGGDVMTGQLQVPDYLKITNVSGVQRLLMGNRDGLGTTRPAIIAAAHGSVRIGYGDTWNGNGGTFSIGLTIDTSAGNGGLTWLGGSVWHAGNDGSGSGLDADTLDGRDGAEYLNISNMTSGVLPVARGGTGSTSVVEHGVAYGNGSGISYTSSPAAGNVLIAGSTGVPEWVNPFSLTVGNAVNANAANSATTAGTATNAVTAQTAQTVPFSGLTGIDPAVGFNSSVRSFGGWPHATATAYARPSYFFDHGDASTVNTLGPHVLPAASITGFSAYNSADMGSYQCGVTVTGPNGNGAQSVQIAAHWNFDEATPNGLRFRINDDSGDTSSWGAWSTLWDQTSLTNLSQLANGPGYVTASTLATSYVAKTGDTMSGYLTGPGFIANSMVRAVDYVQAGTVSAGGFARLQAAGTDRTGFLEVFHPNGVRGGYIGYAAGGQNVATVDTAEINYVAGSHRFSGTVNVVGHITATGNVTAYATSDARKKTDVSTIENALDLVGKMRGVRYTMADTAAREVGVIAQEIAEVVPEVVREAHDGTLGVSYGHLVGVLIEAVKELRAEVAALRA